MADSGRWLRHADPRHAVLPLIVMVIGNGVTGHAKWQPMTQPQQTDVAGFTPGEREFIRRSLDMFFSTYPRVADGIQLRTWRGGPQAGQPKVPPVAQALLARGLMRLDVSQRLPHLFFTEIGLAELRAMMTDRRFADPVKFSHVRQELGIDPKPPATESGT